MPSTPPTKRIGRRFGLIDVMIFVALTAVGLLGTRVLMAATGIDDTTFKDANPFRLSLVMAMCLTPVLALWTIAVSVYGWPTRRRHDRRRDPGYLGSLATLPALTIITGFWIIANAFIYPRGGILNALPGLITGIAGGSVAGLWLTLKVTSRYRRGPDWIARLGLFLGLAWIIMTPLCIWAILIL